MDTEKEPDIFDLTKSMINVKSYRKTIRHKIEPYIFKCRFKCISGEEERFRKDMLEITKIIFSTLDKPTTYEIGNHFFLFSIMETHFTFLDSMVKELLNVDKAYLKNYFDAIHDKNMELLKLVKSNITDPVTLDDLQQMGLDQGVDIKDAIRRSHT